MLSGIVLTGAICISIQYRGILMTVEEAKQILISNRPNRPKSTDRRKLLRAVDLILDALEERNSGEWVAVEDTNLFKCSHCGISEVERKSKFCPDCGAYMGIWDEVADEQ